MEDIKTELDTIKEKRAHPDKNVSREFQQFGYEVAVALNDTRHTSLYIKIAKIHPRTKILRALQFVADYPNARSKPKLFMFKLDQILKENE